MGLDDHMGSDIFAVLVVVGGVYVRAIGNFDPLV